MIDKIKLFEITFKIASVKNQGRWARPEANTGGIFKCVKNIVISIWGWTSKRADSPKETLCMSDTADGRGVARNL